MLVCAHARMRSGQRNVVCNLRSQLMTLTNRKATVTFFLTMTLLLSGRPLPAQESRGQLLGRISDTSGSVIVTAAVRAVNTATSVETTAATNETGDYLLPFLLPGSYTLQVTAPGFKQFVQ